jgi:hypothetical protein
MFVVQLGLGRVESPNAFFGDSGRQVLPRGGKSVVREVEVFRVEFHDKLVACELWLKEELRSGKAKADGPGRGTDNPEIPAGDTCSVESGENAAIDLVPGGLEGE